MNPGFVSPLTLGSPGPNSGGPTSAGPDEFLEVRDFGYGFGPMSGSGYGPERVREERIEREREREREREHHQQRENFREPRDFSREVGGEEMGRLTEGFLDVAAADQDFEALSVALVVEETGMVDSDTRTSHRSMCRPTMPTISNLLYLLRRRYKHLRWLTVRPGRVLKDSIHLPLHRARRLSLLLRMHCTILLRHL